MAAKRKVLATAVHIDGEVYEAGSTPPKEIADRIDNPKAWADAGAEETEES